MKHFSQLDHFTVSEQLYQASVCKQFVVHVVDNTSDHDPLCLHLALNVDQMKLCSCTVHPKPSWDKANDTHINKYKNMLRSKLNSIKLPHSALLCRNVCCVGTEHILNLNEYDSDIAAACLTSADTAIPKSGCKGARGCIPGWTEFTAPLRTNSLFWHNIWIDCGRPHNGTVADIMRKNEGAVSCCYS